MAEVSWEEGEALVLRVTGDERAGDSDINRATRFISKWKTPKNYSRLGDASALCKNPCDGVGVADHPRPHPHPPALYCVVLLMVQPLTVFHGMRRSGLLIEIRE